jgi:hypothetical protein
MLAEATVRPHPWLSNIDTVSLGRNHEEGDRPSASSG